MGGKIEECNCHGRWGRWLLLYWDVGQTNEAVIGKHAIFQFIFVWEHELREWHEHEIISAKIHTQFLPDCSLGANSLLDEGKHHNSSNMRCSVSGCIHQYSISLRAHGANTRQCCISSSITIPSNKLTADMMIYGRMKWLCIWCNEWFDEYVIRLRHFSVTTSSPACSTDAIHW